MHIIIREGAHGFCKQLKNYNFTIIRGLLYSEVMCHVVDYIAVKRLLRLRKMIQTKHLVLSILPNRHNYFCRYQQNMSTN